MPLLWLSLAFLSGILLAAELHISTAGWVLAAILPLVLLVKPIYQRWQGAMPEAIIRANQLLWIGSPRLYPLCLVFIALGGMRYQAAQPRIDPSFIAFYNNQPGQARVEGRLVQPPDRRDTYTNLRVEVDQLWVEGQNIPIPARGKLLVRTYPGSDLEYGDRIRLQGRIETPAEDEDFSYRDYLARQGIYSYMPYPQVDLVEGGQGNSFFAWLYSFQDLALRTVYRLFPDPEAALIGGILLGIESGIPEAVQEAFRNTGTSHIIAISGFNITIIAAFLSLLSTRLLGRYRGAAMAVLGVIFYTLLVGANPAVVRAAILGVMTIIGHLIGRRQAGLNSLAFSGAVMAAHTPSVLWDVSFQLSFAATLGIMLYADPLNRWINGLAGRYMTAGRANRLSVIVGEYFLLTIAAQVTTLPLLMYYFKRVSLTALIANPLILPAQPALMVLGGLAVLTGMVFAPLGQLLAWIAWPFTAYTIRMVELMASIPHGSVLLGQIATPGILVFYALLFALTFFRAHIPAMVRRMAPAVPMGLLAVTSVFVWKVAFYAPDGLLHATILDVGTGEAVLVRSPSGRSVLINGGPSTIRLSDGLGRRLPPFERSVDWLVVADIDNEDLAGIRGNLERFPPGNVLWAGNAHGTRASRALWEQLTALSIPITAMEAGHRLDLGGGSELEVLFTGESGAVLLLRWDDFRLLLPLGMDFEAMEALLRDTAMRSVSAVLLAEAGYAPLSTQEWIDWLQPQVAMISVAPADREGLPSPGTLEALAGYNLLRTDANGWIEIMTDGEQMWVEVERK